MLIDMIKEHEGLRLKCYLDPAGIPTIGWGHTKTVTMDDYRRGKTITKAEAEKLLEDDVAPARAAAHAITGEGSGLVHDAIADFVFNLGPGALHGKTSRIGYHIMNKDWEQVKRGMRRYVYGGGRKLNGLVRRRDMECKAIDVGIKNRN